MIVENWRQRSAGRRLAAVALCLGLSVSSAGAALAQAGSTTFVGSVANVQAAPGERPFVANLPPPQARGAGVSNALAASAAQRFAFSEENAGFTNAGEFGAPVLNTQVRSGLSAFNDPNPHDSSAQAFVTQSDRITISGLAGDNRAVVLHSVLLLEEDNFQFFLPDSPGDYRSSVNAKLRIDSEGIGPSALGNDIFALSDVIQDADHTGGRRIDAPNLIAFNLGFNLGQAGSFSITMNQTLDMTLRASTVQGVDFYRQRIDQAYRLFWLGDAFVTDAATGADLCGLSIAADSGANYGSIAACPGGGGDHGGGTSVPEPAAWALMIVGFGLTGAALRRRRLGQEALGL